MTSAVYHQQKKRHKDEIRGRVEKAEVVAGLETVTWSAGA